MSCSTAVPTAVLVAACVATGCRAPSHADAPDAGSLSMESGDVALAQRLAAGGPGAPYLPLHDLCLFKLGINLGEMWYLSELAEWLRTNARTRFFLTAPPLRLPGHVGSPVTPIATV